MKESPPSQFFACVLIILMFSVKVQDKRKGCGQTYAMKALVKQHIVETKQQEHVYNEKKILMELDSPFIIRYLNISNGHL